MMPTQCPKCESGLVGPITIESRVMECRKCDHTWHTDGGEANETTTHKQKFGNPETMHNKAAAKPIPAVLPHARPELVETAHLAIREMRRQDAKWGVRQQDTGMWAKILMEEVGETSEAALQMDFDSATSEAALQMDFDSATSEHYEQEMIQVAAVAMQAATDFRIRRLANANPRSI